MYLHATLACKMNQYYIIGTATKFFSRIKKHEAKFSTVHSYLLASHVT